MRKSIHVCIPLCTHVYTTVYTRVHNIALGMSLVAISPRSISPPLTSRLSIPCYSSTVRPPSSLLCPFCLEILIACAGECPSFLPRLIWPPIGLFFFFDSSLALPLPSSCVSSLLFTLPLRPPKCPTSSSRVSPRVRKVLGWGRCVPDPVAKSLCIAHIERGLEDIPRREERTRYVRPRHLT